MSGLWLIVTEVLVKGNGNILRTACLHALLTTISSASQEEQKIIFALMH